MSARWSSSSQAVKYASMQGFTYAGTLSGGLVKPNQ